MPQELHFYVCKFHRNKMHISSTLWIMRHCQCFCLMRLACYYLFKALEVLFCLGYKDFIYPSPKLWDKWIIMFACFGSQMCFTISAKEARLWLEAVDTVCLLAKKTLKWLVAFKLERLLNKEIKGCDYMYPQCVTTTLFALTGPYHGWSCSWFENTPEESVGKIWWFLWSHHHYSASLWRLGTRASFLSLNHRMI